MGAPRPQSAQCALLNLERCSALESELLDQAARILGTGFVEMREQLFLGAGEESAQKNVLFAPKEEWVLRWLFKRTKAVARTVSPSSGPGTSVNDDPRTWLLFCHLVPRAPAKKTAKILREQDAMHQIQDALINLLNGQKTPDAPSALSGWQPLTSCDSANDGYELPQGESRKRKRSPETEEAPGKDSSTVLVIFSILRALKECIKVALDPNREDIVSQQHMRIALSLPPEAAATILGHAFGVVNRLLGRIASPLRNDLLNHLQGALHLWALRQGPHLGHTVDECNGIFRLHCLLPGLLLLRSIRDSGLTDQHVDVKSWLEKHIVQHAVEPARNVFFNELADKWKPDQDPILSEHLKPTVARLQTLLFPSHISGSGVVDAEGSILTFQLIVPILLEITLRSGPSSTIRKAQHEKPWLEAFLVFLAHMGGCSLIDEGKVRQVTNGQRKSHPQAIAYVSHQGSSSSTCLEGLLSTAIQWKLSLSLPLLSSLTLHFADLPQHHSIKWDVVARALQIDVNAFLPNSGISTAKELLDHLIEALSTDSNLSDHDNTISSNRHSLVDLVNQLMGGFASARDLGTFVNIWMDRLTAVEDARTSTSRTGDHFKSYCLWEDEDVMTGFVRAAKISATPTFIASHLLETTQALRNQTYTGRHYALITVLDLLVLAHKEEIGSIQDTVDLLYDGVQNKLQPLNTSGKLGGMLWRLLRHIFPLTGKSFPKQLFEESFEGGEKGIVEQAMKNANAGSVSGLTSILNFNEIERFHCFITMAALYPSAVTRQLESEISSLAHHLVGLGSWGELKRCTGAHLWDGRGSSLERKFDLSTAFVGILLQSSQVLCLHIDATISLLKVIALHLASEDEGNQSIWSGLVYLFKAIVLDEALVSTPGFVKKVVKATSLLDDCRLCHLKIQILQALPREAMSKAQRKQIAEWLYAKAAASQRDSAGFAVADIGAIASTEHSEITYGEFERTCRDALKATTSPTREDVINFCQSLRKVSPSPADFLRLGSMLKGGITFPHVTGLAADLSALLPKSASLQNFCLTAGCIQLTLDKHHESVNQWIIDNLVTQIAITLSPKGPNIPDAAPIIFERLCRLLGVVLGRYRIRLGGRYHLLLPALYGLLHYLFMTPDPSSMTTQSQVLFYSKCPPWVHSSTSRLPKESATHLTRLLTSICDPTPSAVKKSRSPLIDETKKARKVAGQYMQYFVAEYAYCQLNGRIDVEAKAALMPGLYAALDAMGKEVMRGMNAKMDASQRAIFKSLYEDYTRFGRWNGM